MNSEILTRIVAECMEEYSRPASVLFKTSDVESAHSKIMAEEKLPEGYRMREERYVVIGEEEFISVQPHIFTPTTWFGVPVSKYIITHTDLINENHARAVIENNPTVDYFVKVSSFKWLPLGDRDMVRDPKTGAFLFEVLPNGNGVYFRPNTTYAKRHGRQPRPAPVP